MPTIALRAGLACRIVSALPWASATDSPDCSVAAMLIPGYAARPCLSPSSRWIRFGALSEPITMATLPVWPIAATSASACRLPAVTLSVPM